MHVNIVSQDGSPKFAKVLCIFHEVCVKMSKCPKMENSSFSQNLNKSGIKLEYNIQVFKFFGVKVENLKILFHFHSSFTQVWNKT